MNNYKQQALDILNNFEDSNARNSLELLVRFSTERKS
jgi:geranylgeranyl pyrophosphate synthase